MFERVSFAQTLPVRPLRSDQAVRFDYERVPFYLAWCATMVAGVLLALTYARMARQQKTE